MRRSILFLILAAVPALAESRDYPQPCADVYRRAVQTMTAAHFEPTVSDAAGGVLALKFTGEPMVYNFMVKHATPYLDKYVVGGAVRKYRGLTFTKANATLAPVGEGCRVTLDVGLSAVDMKSQSGKWVRTYTELKSNGTAEREFLDRLTEAK